MEPLRRIEQILEKQNFTSDEIIEMLEAKGEAIKLLFSKAVSVKRESVRNKVYFRRLIEFSNICSKDYLYCGIRKENRAIERFNLTDEQILDAARFAIDNQYGSIVLQSGELRSKAFTRRISNLLRKINHLSQGNLRINLIIW